VAVTIKEKYQQTNLWRSTRILSRNDQRKIGAVIFLQIAFSILDLIGVALIGVIGALAIRGVSSQQPGDRVSTALKVLNLDNQDFQMQVAILALAATTLLVLRTVLSILFTRRTLRFLARRGASITENLFERLLSQSLMGIQKRSSQESLYALTNGVSVIVIGILGTIVAVISDSALLIVLSFGIFVVDPTTAILATIFFGFMGLIMYKSLHGRVRTLGIDDYKLTVSSNERILEVLSAYRESVVKNRRNYYVKEIGELRQRLANVQAELSFIPYISKYVIETAVILGAVLIGGFQFIINDASRAVATLAIFLAAGTRVAPAVLRVQQGAILIKGNLAVATPTLDLIEELSSLQSKLSPDSDFVLSHQGFVGSVELRGTSFTYPGTQAAALNDVNLKLEPGEHAVIVGSSGAGKTTLVDVILGVIDSQKGSVAISGMKPLDAILTWPGAIAYVPQDVLISNSTIRENITMGYETLTVPDIAIWEALKLAQLDELVRGLPEGLNSLVGDRGAKISGGQRQRLGIARALLTKPKLLVLDEATSSLDGETEANISEGLSSLEGEVTVILIAHRLSSVRNSKKVIYMHEGNVLCQGDFDFVRNQVPDFDKQAKLMGL
jgi:ABC-type multidrug transport system fused ATPase/permease subunit